MKVLIIGAKGLLGSYLVKTFTDQEVVAWDRAEIDITDEGAVREQVLGCRPGVLINCAAYNDVDRAETEPEVANAVNGHAVGYLAMVARDLDIPFVSYSSVFVFDGKDPRGYSEDATPSPQSAYARSKVLGETKMAAVGNKWYLVRTSRLFGALPQDHVGKKPFPDLMLDLAAKKPYLEVVDDEMDSPTYALDLAKSTRDVVESQQPYGIYHRTNAGVCSWYEWAREVFRIKNMAVDVRPVPRSRFPVPAPRPQHAILQTTRLPPLRPWQQALQEYLIPET